MAVMEEKTNVMRLIEQKRLPYRSHYYGDTGAVGGLDVAAALGQDPDAVFKTLVCTGKSGAHYVFVIPVSGELDLKKAARSVGEKSVDMLKSKDLLPLTGYVHGGCSPIGMKKFFATTVDASAATRDTICFSAGRIGYQVEMAVADLSKLIRLQLADVVE